MVTQVIIGLRRKNQLKDLNTRMHFGKTGGHGPKPPTYQETGTKKEPNAYQIKHGLSPNDTVVMPVMCSVCGQSGSTLIKVNEKYKHVKCPEKKKVK